MIDREQLKGLVDERVIPPPAAASLGSPTRTTHVADRDRILGALVGCAVGDALGGPNEGRNVESRIRIEDVDPRRARISDDTQLTIEIARNIVENGGAFDPVGFGQQLVEWLPRAVGIGRATREAVLRLRRGEPWHAAGTPSAGNGAAMRVAPIGLVQGADLDRLRLDASVSALPTHHDPTAAASSVAMAYATAWCASADPATVDPVQLLHDIDTVLADLDDPGLEPRQPGVGGRVTVRSAIAALGETLDMTPDDYFTRFWSGALVTESLPAALWCLLRSPGDPLEVIRPAAELARDADTVAAMAGTLAGALHGRSGLSSQVGAVLPGGVVGELETLAGMLAELRSDADASRAGESTTDRRVGPVPGRSPVVLSAYRDDHGPGSGDAGSRRVRLPSPADASGPGAVVDADGARDRAIGALLGLACGDAVGTTLEFKAPGSFTPIDDMVGGGPFGLEPGEWTDDTSMALCLAESLLDRGELDGTDQMRRYLLWSRSGYLSSNGRCFDIGNTVSAQLSRFERTGAAVDPYSNPESAANGSLMRLAAVPIRWYQDVGEAGDRSAESSRTTHGAPRPVDACRVMGAMVAALIGGALAGEVLDPGFWRWGELDPAIRAVVGGSWRTKAASEIRGTGYCVDALEAAIWAVAGARDFRSAVLRAANLGDDADTTAAIAGQLAGARWGAAGIPAAWRDTVVMRDRIEALASGLYDAAVGVRVPGEAAPWRHDEFLHAWWVVPGVLAGEYPGDSSPVRARRKLDLLVDAGVRTIVDLTTPADGLADYSPLVTAAASARGLDLRHERRPIPDLGVVDDAAYDEIVALVAEARQEGAVYVHCWGGVGRTGTVAGCLLLHDGCDGGDVVGRLAELRAGTRKAERPCPETAGQLDVLHRRSGGPAA